ncbi:hypothetical protein [Cellulomonas hominis]
MTERPGAEPAGTTGAPTAASAEPSGSPADALRATQPPTAEILLAVHNGLRDVPAGSPTAWFEVPSQRGRTSRPTARRDRGSSTAR